jgi:hypothetical protein
LVFAWFFFISSHFQAASCFSSGPPMYRIPPVFSRSLFTRSKPSFSNSSNLACSLSNSSPRLEMVNQGAGCLGSLMRIAVENRQVIAQAIKAGFTINLSTDNPAHADRLAELGIAPVVTVLARAYARRAVRHRFKRRRDEWAETIGEWRDRTASLPRHTPAGRRIAICPATYSEATCKTCGACARVRDVVIGFPAHGDGRREIVLWLTL